MRMRKGYGGGRGRKEGRGWVSICERSKTQGMEKTDKKTEEKDSNSEMAVTRVMKALSSNILLTGKVVKGFQRGSKLLGWPTGCSKRYQVNQPYETVLSFGKIHSQSRSKSIPWKSGSS